jgi:hypothetical protein
MTPASFLKKMRCDILSSSSLHWAERNSQEQPLSIVFQKITEAIGLYDHYCEIQQHLPVEDDQWSQHLVQSHVWDAAGKLIYPLPTPVFTNSNWQGVLGWVIWRELYS